MKLGDVRAGNYAQDEQGNLLMVIGFDADSKNVVYSVVDRSKYPLPDGWSANPIPMDKDWMKRCGLPTHNSTQELLWNYTMGFRRARGKLLMEDMSGNYERRIEFVHEYQNIVRILTGEDPEINLEGLI
jgi:hypothetical protein